jgi:hypothetical protein
MTQKTPAGLADCFTCCEVPQGCPERLVREASEDAAESPEEIEAFDAAAFQARGSAGDADRWNGDAGVNYVANAPPNSERLVDLWARSDERDYEERHYSDQNVDNAAHRDPANSSHRRPFRRWGRNTLRKPQCLAAAAAEDRD